MQKGPVTRSRILEAALRVASVDGLEGISLGRVAADVGMSKSGLFAHFASKEQLQLDVIQAATERFEEIVVRPALAAPRGEPRLRALFEQWLVWGQHESLPGGCVFVHAAVELDDRPGPARDALAASQRQWLATIARAVRIAIGEGHFRQDVDAEQFAFQVYGLVLGANQLRRLLDDPQADARVRRGFDTLVQAARVSAADSAAAPA
jgi:AcrR family transcriptional regulator